MKRLIGGLLLLLITSQAHAIFGLEKLKLFQADLQLLKNEVTTAKNENNAVKAEMNGKIVGLETKIDKLEIKLENNMNANIGVGNQANRAGRDMKTSNRTTNDTSLMKYMLYTMGGICLSLIGALKIKDKQVYDANDKAMFYLLTMAKSGHDIDDVVKKKNEYFKGKSIIGKITNKFKRSEA